MPGRFRLSAEHIAAFDEAHRQDIANRLVAYLHLHHADIIQDLDLDEFAWRVVLFAESYKIVEDEGIAWLAAVLLAGRRTDAGDMGWVVPLLRDLELRGLPEEERLHHIHEEAVKRGWLSE